MLAKTYKYMYLYPTGDPKQLTTSASSSRLTESDEPKFTKQVSMVEGGLQLPVLSWQLAGDKGILIESSRETQLMLQ